MDDLLELEERPEAQVLGFAIPDEVLERAGTAQQQAVHMVPKQPVTTLAKYDEMVRAQDKYSTSNNARSESSVVKTISE